MAALTFDFCRRDELERTGFLTKWLEDLRDEVTVLLVEGTAIAYSSICPHFGGEFTVDPSVLELRCRWHGWRFDARTGECLTYPTRCRLRRYAVESDGERLRIRHELPDR